MRSLRDRLVVGSLLVMTAVLAAGGVAVYSSVQHRMAGELDRSLDTLARATAPNLLGEHIRQRRDRPPREERPSRPSSSMDALLERSDLWIQGWSIEDERVLVRSSQLGDMDLPRLAGPLDEVVFGDHALENGTTLRVATLGFQPPPRPAHERNGPGPGPPGRRRPNEPEPRDRSEPNPPVLVVSIARSDADLRAALGHLRGLLLLTWAGSVLLGAALLTRVVRSSLTPLDRLGEEIAALDASHLDRRIEVDGAPTELLPVIEQLNQSVERIGSALDRERSFTSSAAHELRTPLAGLRATLEVATGRTRPVEEHVEAERTCLHIVEQMQALTEGLLELARGETAAETAVERPLALFVMESLAAHERDLMPRGLSIERAVSETLTVRTDERLVRRVIDNVVGNAAAYASEGGTIRITGAREDDDVSLCISNPAPNLPTDAGTRAFETFWRADEARESGKHAGLGLPLCRRIMDRLGGSIHAEVENDHFLVTIRLPAA